MSNVAIIKSDSLYREQTTHVELLDGEEVACAYQVIKAIPPRSAPSRVMEKMKAVFIKEGLPDPEIANANLRLSTFRSGKPGETFFVIGAESADKLESVRKRAESLLPAGWRAQPMTMDQMRLLQIAHAAGAGVWYTP